MRAGSNKNKPHRSKQPKKAITNLTVIPIKTTSGYITAKVELADGRSWFLHSPENPVKEANEWVENIEWQNNCLYIIFGFGLGYHIKSALDKLPDNSWLYVVEASKKGNTIDIAREILPKPKWLNDDRLKLVAADDVRQLAGQLADFMRQKRVKDIKLVEYKPVVNLFLEKYQNLAREVLHKTAEMFCMGLSFPSSAGNLYAFNSWDNLPYIATSPGIKCFEKKFNKQPAIIAAGGPSLDYTAPLLRDRENEFIIIAAGSAIGGLKKHGVVPHFVTVLDPFEAAAKEVYEFAEKETVLMASYEVPRVLLDEFSGTKVFCRNNDNYFTNEFRQLLPENIALLRNVSVSTQAFFFALAIGADPIIFIGQDLAFTPEKCHADGVTAGSYFNEGGHYQEIIGQDGKKLFVNSMLKDLRAFYEQLIAAITDRKIINSSTGGAIINGAIHKDLSAVIDEYGGHKTDNFTKIKQLLKNADIPTTENIRNRLIETMEWFVSLQEKINELTTKVNEKFSAVGNDMIIAENICREVNALIKTFMDILEKEQQFQYLSAIVEIQRELMELNLIDNNDYRNECHHWCQIIDNLKIISDILFKKITGALTEIVESDRQKLSV